MFLVEWKKRVIFVSVMIIYKKNKILFIKLLLIYILFRFIGKSRRFFLKFRIVFMLKIELY